jgi:hypothetical protein
MERRSSGGESVRTMGLSSAPTPVEALEVDAMTKYRLVEGDS